MGVLAVSKEIEILLEANRKGCLIVEKDTHLLWEREELLEAEQTGLYQEKGQLVSPEGQIEVTGPYPGCLQQAAASRDDLDFRLLGQTRHFVIFARRGSQFCEASVPA
jgi:hypothetical protein